MSILAYKEYIYAHHSIFVYRVNKLQGSLKLVRTYERHWWPGSMTVSERTRQLIVTDVRHRQLVFFNIGDDGLPSGAWHEEISRESTVPYFKPFATLAEENGLFLLTY